MNYEIRKMNLLLHPNLGTTSHEYMLAAHMYTSCLTKLPRNLETVLEFLLGEASWRRDGVWRCRLYAHSIFDRVFSHALVGSIA